MNPPRGVPVGSWDSSRNWRDRLDVQLRGACSLSQFVCLSIAPGQPQCDVHVCMVRVKLEHSHTSSLLRLPAKEAENSLGTWMWPWNAISSSRSVLTPLSCCPAPGLPWESEAQPFNLPQPGTTNPSTRDRNDSGFFPREAAQIFDHICSPACHTHRLFPQGGSEKGLLRGKKMQWLCKGRQIPALHPHGPCPG